jgi:hypothetical protein
MVGTIDQIGSDIERISAKGTENIIFGRIFLQYAEMCEERNRDNKIACQICYIRT